MALRIATQLRSLSVALLLVSSARAASAASAASETSSHEDEELQAPAELEPSAIHWALAAILAVALFLGLMRVMRVLRKEDVFTPMRHAPEGMRPVQCGACHAMQHVTLHGRIFICFSCHSANRLSADIFNPEEPQLVAASGPLRSFEFHREGQNFFKETKRTEISDSEAAELIAASVTVSCLQRSRSIRSNASDVVPVATGIVESTVVAVDGDTVSLATPRSLEAAENNAQPTPSNTLSPRLLGHSTSGLESVASSVSRKSGNGNVP